MKLIISLRMQSILQIQLYYFISLILNSLLKYSIGSDCDIVQIVFDFGVRSVDRVGNYKCQKQVNVSYFSEFDTRVQAEISFSFLVIRTIILYFVVYCCCQTWTAIQPVGFQCLWRYKVERCFGCQCVFWLSSQYLLWVSLCVVEWVACWAGVKQHKCMSRREYESSRVASETSRTISVFSAYFCFLFLLSALNTFWLYGQCSQRTFPIFCK